MNRIKRARPSPALVISVLALFVALGGTAIAVKKAQKNSVFSSSIKNKQVKSADISNKKGVKSKDIVRGAVSREKIAGGAVNGAKVADGSIGDEKLSEIDLFGDSFVRATPTVTNSDLPAAQAAAPKVPLWSKGQLSAYGKCFTADFVPETWARIYVETSAPGAILSSTSALGGAPDLDGDPDFLDPGTDESDRWLESVSGGAGSFRAKQLSRVAFVAMSPDGTAVDGLASVAVKRSGPDGVYGSGASCLFSGFGIG